MNDRLLDLLIEFDEMGFAPTTVCEEPEEYAKKWRDRVLEEVKALETENADLRERLKKTERRAEAAERKAIVLSKWLADKTRKDYPYQAWLEAAQKQAEKEHAEEGKS